MRDIIEKAVAKGAERCEVYSLSSLNTDVEYEASRLKNLVNNEESGLALRLVKDGRLGYATTTKVEDADRLIDDALATATCGEKVDYGFSGSGEMPAPAISDGAVKALTLEQMMKRSEDAIARIHDYEKEIKIESGTSRRVQKIGIATSEGLEAGFERTLYQFYVEGLLVEGDNMLSAGGFYGGSRLDDGGHALVDEAIDDFRNGRKNVGVAGGPTRVVFTPRAIADVMLTLNYGVNGAFVERGVSPLKDKLGETIFDERITLHDDGLLDTGFAAAPFDDEGVPMQSTPVIEAGVLRNFLTDLRTGEKLDLPLTGNGLKLKRLIQQKELGKIPGPEITNWVMKGGERPYAEILKEIDSGVVVDSIMGIMMGNLVAGDFSGNVALGFKVENGKLVGRVKDTMVAGNVYKLLKDQLVELSSEVKRVGIMGFIGSHMYPYVLCKDVSISAKG